MARRRAGDKRATWRRLERINYGRAESIFAFYLTYLAAGGWRPASARPKKLTRLVIRSHGCARPRCSRCARPADSGKVRRAASPLLSTRALPVAAPSRCASCVPADPHRRSLIIPSAAGRDCERSKCCATLACSMPARAHYGRARIRFAGAGSGQLVAAERMRRRLTGTCCPAARQPASQHAQRVGSN